MKQYLLISFIIAFVRIASAQNAIDVAQRIDLDGKVSAGGLQLFPSLDNPDDYYYMPDKVQIGRTAQGNLPQFSYLRFFKPTKTANGTGNSEATEAGGILHAVVELQVSDQQKQRAASELLKYNPNGKIKGSLTYDKCFFTLVTSLATKDYEKITSEANKEEKFPSMKIDSELTKSIAGYGSGPVLEGEKAAISIRLTALGSQIFWQSLQMATPDISFQFEVEFSGYRRPIPAKIEANFDRIYDSKFYQSTLNASVPMGNAIATAEVDVSKMMDSLFTKNIIKITMSGNDKDDAIINDIKNDFIAMMFDKATDSKGNPGFNAMGIGELEKGAEKKEVETVKPSSTGIITKTEDSKKAKLDAISTFDISGYGVMTVTKGKEAVEAFYFYENNKTNKIVKPLEGEICVNGNFGTFWTKFGEGKSVENATSLGDSVLKYTNATNATDKKVISCSDISGYTNIIFEEGQNAEDAKVLENGKEFTKPGNADGTFWKAYEDKDADKMNQLLDEYKGIKVSETPDQAITTQNATGSTPAPTLKLSVAYREKKIRRKGIYVVELNRYTAKTIKSTFTENIGNFSRYKNDPRIFKQVNLDEMFGKQREITPVVDGFNAADFGNLLNSVNVRLVKKHEKGATSTDEVTITKQNLGAVALDGKLMYAWKEDNDQARFDQYQYETTWSYVGVGDIKTPLKIEKEQSFTVYPPYKAADVSVVVAEDARLNAAIVKIYYKVGEKEIVKDLVFMPTAKTQPTQRILIPTEGNYEYQYEVIWKLKGGVTKTTPRTTETTTQIFLEIPQ